MNTPNSKSGAVGAHESKPAAEAQQPTPAPDMQPEDAGTPASGAANRGSPAAPVMKQFAKTKAESTGRP